MRILYLVFLIILLGTYSLVLNRLRNSFAALTPILGWMVGLAFWVIAPLTILTLNGGFEMPTLYNVAESWGEVDLARPNFLNPYFVIWLSLMLTCVVAYLFCPAALPKKGSDSLIAHRKLERVLLITMALSVLDWVVMVWHTGGIAEFLVSHWYRRNEDLVERFGGAFILYSRLALANQVLLTGAAALYTSVGLRNRTTSRRFTSFVLVFFLLEIIMTGNRIFFALYLLAFFSSCWLYWRKRIIAVTLVASPIIILIFSAWGAVRHDLSKIPDSVTTGVIEADVRNRAIASLMDVTEGTNVMLLMHMINDFGDRFDYLYGSTYSRLFTFFLPKSIYPSRPPDFTTLAASLYEAGEPTSLASTALGEGYANFGFFGIFVLPLFTWFALRYTNWLMDAGERHSLVSAVSFVMFIWFARSTFAENAVTLAGAVLLIWAFRLERGLCFQTAAHKHEGSVGKSSRGLPPGFSLRGEVKP